MRVVGTRQQHDCGVCALACALDISWAQARHLLWPNGWSAKKRKWGTNTKQIVNAIASSNLADLWGTTLYTVTPEEAELDIYITKVILPSHKGTSGWHWVVIRYRQDGMRIRPRVFDSILNNWVPLEDYKRMYRAEIRGGIAIRRIYPDITWSGD